MCVCMCVCVYICVCCVCVCVQVGFTAKSASSNKTFQNVDLTENVSTAYVHVADI